MITSGVRVVNAGLDLITEGVPDALQLDWRPPAFGDAEVARLAAGLDVQATRSANDQAISRVHSARPEWTRTVRAADALPVLSEGRTLLYAGPPIKWERMCDPVRGALVGATLFEGWADSPDGARGLLASGAVTLSNCHGHGAVGPMAGVISPSMFGFLVEDGEARAFTTLNEGLGKVLRFGAYDESVLERLRWMRDELGPTLDAVLRQGEPVDVTGLIGQALAMGDEGHNRNIAATSLLARRLAGRLAALGASPRVFAFLAENDHFTLNLSMAAAKLAMDAGRDVPGSTLVVAMCRNGVEFGIQVSGTGDRWFTAPVGPADGLFFPGYSIADANPDLGDSAITETLGIGGFAMAAAPAITRFVGGTPADALAATASMERITMRRHPAYPIPATGFRGAPSGIDVLKVIDTNVLPVINTGIAHRQAGVGQIGAGIVTAPAGVFLDAVRGLAEAARP